jgi:U3 small nucleolar RNA-associated protein 18
MVLSGSSKQFLFEFKMNEACNSVCFDNESKYLFSAGAGGKIYQWDLNKRAIFSCINDVGSTNTTCLALSKNYLASGNTSGTVNIYDCGENSIINRQPLKEIQNLTTSITDLKWNKEGEMLGIFSKWKRNAIRLTHFPTMTVFSNWPNLKTNLKFISSLAFSDDCKHMALGNDEGRVYMYDFPYY